MSVALPRPLARERKMTVASLQEGQDPASWLSELGNAGLHPSADQRLENGGVDPEGLVPAT